MINECYDWENNVIIAVGATNFSVECPWNMKKSACERARNERYEKELWIKEVI